MSDAVTEPAHSARAVTREAEYLERAHGLVDLVRKHGDQAEADRRLPAEVARAMAEQGLYRVCAPRSYLGGEASPSTQIRVIETISQADGAAGWNLMIGIEAFGLLALGFPEGAELFRDPLAIVSASTASLGRADLVEGGVRLSGDWQFVSGVHGCSFFAGLALLHEDGAPKLGAPPHFVIVDADEIEIVDAWHVGGMRGSGSHDVRVRDVFVPEDRLVALQAGTSNETALAKVPHGARLAYNKVGVCLGIARGAIDDVRALAQDKLPRFSGVKLRERPGAQRAVAQAEARLRGARAFVFERVEALWADAHAGRTPGAEDRALLQLACIDCAAACVEAVDLVADVAGTTANRLDFPLERRARDVRVVRQHVTVASYHLEDVGRVLLGLEAEGFMLAMPQGSG